MRRAPRDESGQVSLLLLGLFLIVATLVIGGLAVTSVHIARTRLLDVADGAALSAANALDPATAYGSGVGEAVPLTNASVGEAAARYVAARPLPTDVQSWAVASGTGTPDGATAVVRVTARVRVPLIGGVLDALGGSVTITVESRARASTS